MAALGRITLPPMPAPGRSPEEYQRAVAAWTRACEQTIRQIERYLLEVAGASGGVLPAGGVSGQVLTKASGVDGDATWATPQGVPAGGAAGQVLTKGTTSHGWATPRYLPPGGTSGQALKKLSAADGDAGWVTESGGGGGSGLPEGGAPGQYLQRQEDGAGWATVHEVPDGGTTGQALRKQSDNDQDAAWAAVKEVPDGGTTGQALRKQSNDDQDAAWAAVKEVPDGGTTGQALRKQSDNDQDAAWAAVKEVPDGGTTGQVLTKLSDNDQDLVWGNAWGNEVQQRALVLCAGYTPALLGADVAELTVPFDTNGLAPVTWNVVRVSLRVAVAGGSPAIQIEKSSETGLFDGSVVGEVVLASGAYEGAETDGLGQVESGDKLRFSVLDLGTATGWTVTVELTEDK